MLRNETNSASGRLLGMTLSFAALTLGGCGNIHERAEFSALVMGKSGEEVITQIGKPDAVDSSNPAHVAWTFKHATFNLAGENRKDAQTVVTLVPKGAEGGLVADDVKFVP